MYVVIDSIQWEELRNQMARIVVLLEEIAKAAKERRALDDAGRDHPR